MPPPWLDPAIVTQIQASLDRLGHVYPPGTSISALVRAMPYFDEGGWDADVEAYFRADVRVRPDGTVQARSPPEHIREAIEGDARGRLAGARRPHHAADAAPARAGQLRAARLASDPLARGRRADGGVDGRLPRLVDGVGNHLTFVFGRGAQRPDAMRSRGSSVAAG